MYFLQFLFLRHEIKMSLISVKKLIKMRYVFTRINISVHIRLIFH